MGESRHFRARAIVTQLFSLPRFIYAVSARFHFRNKLKVRQTAKDAIHLLLSGFQSV